MKLFYLFLAITLASCSENKKENAVFQPKKFVIILSNRHPILVDNVWFGNTNFIIYFVNDSWNYLLSNQYIKVNRIILKELTPTWEDELAQDREMINRIDNYFPTHER